MIPDAQHDQPRRHDPQKKHYREISAVKKLPHAARCRTDGTADIAPQAGGAETRDLQPGRGLGATERAEQIQLLGFFAAQFSAGGFWNASRRQQFDAVRWQAETFGDLLGDRGNDGGAAAGVGFARFGYDHQAFGAAGFVFQAESDDAAFANAFDARGEFFDFVRVEVAAAFDDDVFHAAGDVDFAVGAIGTVAGIYPGVFAFLRGGASGEQLCSGGGVAKKPFGGGRPAEPQKSFGAIRDFVAFLVYDANINTVHGVVGRNKRDGVGVAGRDRDSLAVSRKRLASNAID